MSTTFAYGWKPDPPDARDVKFTPRTLLALPAKVDLRLRMPPPDDQLDIGACTAFGTGKAIKFLVPTFDVSQLFIYYNARVMGGTVNQDAGAIIRDVFKSIAREGAAPSALWPYDTSKFRQMPTRAAYTAAMEHQAVKYNRVSQSLEQIKGTLAQGFPITFGFSVYESFESQAVARTGIMPMPGSRERVVGGHCVAAFGYDDASQWINCRNSWTAAWGDKGDFYMPYRFIANPGYASDFWVLTEFEGQAAPPPEPEPTPIPIPTPTPDLVEVKLGSQVVYLPKGTSVEVVRRLASGEVSHA